MADQKYMVKRNNVHSWGHTDIGEANTLEEAIGLVETDYNRCAGVLAVDGLSEGDFTVTDHNFEKEWAFDLYVISVGSQ